MLTQVAVLFVFTVCIQFTCYMYYLVLSQVSVFNILSNSVNCIMDNWTVAWVYDTWFQV